MAELLALVKLSGGMKKLLALAVNSRQLVLDQSFSSLDSNLKVESYEDLRCIWRETVAAILLITHDSRDLENLAIGRPALRPTSPPPARKSGS